MLGYVRSTCIWDRLTEPNLRLTLLPFYLMPSNSSKYLLLCRFLQIGTGSYPEKVLTCQQAYRPILRRSQTGLCCKNTQTGLSLEISPKVPESE